MESQISGGSTYRLGQNSREIGVRVSFQQPAVNYLDRQTTCEPHYRLASDAKFGSHPVAKSSYYCSDRCSHSLSCIADFYDTNEYRR